VLIQEALGTEVDRDGAHEADRAGAPAVGVLDQLAAALGQGGAAAGGGRRAAGGGRRAAGGPFCGQDVRVAAVFRSPLAHGRDDGAHLSRAQSPETGRILGQRVVVVVEDALDVVVPCDDPRADLVGVVHGVGLAQQRVARVRIVEHRLVEQGAGSPMPPDRGVRSAQGAARVRVKRAACRSRAPHRLARAPARP
jgi:hypothetical protein